MRRYFRNRKLQKHVKHYVDPNAIRDDKDDATSYLKDIAGLATILGVGATGGALFPNGRVYAAQTSVDPKSQVVGSVSDFIKSGASDTTGSKSDSKTFSISASEDKAKSTSASKSTQLSQSLSKSLSQSISQSESLSHSLSESESALNSLSLAKSKEKEAKSNKQATSTSHKSDNKVSQSETANVKKSGQNNRRSAENSLSNNSTSANQEQSSTYASTSNDITTNLQASLNLSNDLSSLSNLPLAFNSVSSNNSTSNNSNSQLPVTLAANFMTLAATDDAVVKPQFTGDAVFGNLNTSNKEFVSGNGINYTSTSTNLPTLSVRLSTYGSSTVNNPQFIVMIPKGFTSSTTAFGLIPNNPENYFNGTFSGSNTNKDYSIQDLGKIGPKGAQLFKITLNFNPSWDSANNFGGQFELSFDPTAPKKYYSYDPSGAPIVSELADDAIPSATGDSNHYTFTAGGQNINVVKSSYYQGIDYGIDTTAIPEFTGTAWLNANGKSYNSTTVPPTYTFRLSTWGDSTVKDPKFIIMIPAGFTATENNFTFNSGYPGSVKVTSLGNYGPHKEELFEVSLTDNTAKFNNGSISGSVKLTLNPSVTGQYTYSDGLIPIDDQGHAKDGSAPLISEISDYGKEGAEAGAGGGTYTFNVNGKKIEVVRSQYTVNEKQWNENGSVVTYAVNQAVKPTFTGTATLGNLSNGTFVSADGTNYNTDAPSTKLPTLNVRLSTNGPTTITNPQFIVTIPKGFKVTGNSLISSDTVSKYFDGNFKGTNTLTNNEKYTVESLGTNSNGEEIYSVKLNFNPSESDNKDLGLQFQLSLDPSAKGKFTYNSSTPLVTELASDGQNTAGTATITVNGTTYDVVKSSNATNLSYYINDAHIPYFTGTANLLDANGNPIADGTVYSGTQVPKYTFRLSTSGDSTVQNPKFIVMIPAGFTATTDSFKFNYGAYKGTAKVEKLDGKGLNGEQLFEVTLSGATPNFQTAQVSGSIALTPNFTGDNGGSHTYSNSVAPLISEFATDAQSPWGTYTFNTGTGTVKVVQSPQTVNWLDAGNKAANSSASVNYIIQVGKDKLDNDAYTISKVDPDPNKPMVVPHEGKASDKAGYEELSFVFTPKGELKDGQYFDVHLGLPGQNGVELYDKTLGNNLPIYA